MSTTLSKTIPFCDIYLGSVEPGFEDVKYTAGVDNLWKTFGVG